MRSCEEGVMGVAYSGHGVNLVVLVRTHSRDFLNGSPVGEGGLSVVEPFVAELSHEVGVMVRDALGNLRAGDATA